MRLHKCFAFLLVAVFIRSTAFAQSGLLTSPQEDLYRSRISEYFFQRSSKDILKPIKVLGSVTKPGLYHIPPNTSLTQVLALSGGTIPEANLEKITIARTDGRVEQRDLMKIVKSGQDPVLNEGDMIFVPKEDQLISGSTSSAMIAIATILSVALTGYIAFKND